MHLKQANKLILLSTAILFFDGCSAIDTAKRNLIAAYAQNSLADWRLEREKPEYAGFYGIPQFENPLIAQGNAAVPVAKEFLRSFDHRIRCSGLTILLCIRGAKNIKSTLIDHLDDSYGPIRWECWYLLKDMKLVTLESMPKDEDYLSGWRQVKREAQMRLITEEKLSNETVGASAHLSIPVHTENSFRVVEGELHENDCSGQD